MPVWPKVVSKRFSKKQQMQWSKPGAHLLLQTRVKTLDGELGAVFKRWYPDMDLDSGEFCEWPKLNTRGYLCTLGVPTHSIHQKGYPLAQAHCTAFAHTPGLFVWFAPTSEQATMATCAAPRRCADRLGNTA